MSKPASPVRVALILFLCSLFWGCRDAGHAVPPDESAAATSVVAPVEEPKTEPEPEPESVEPPVASEPKQLRFLSCNLEAHQITRGVEGEERSLKILKAAKEIAALAKIIVDADPDVLGISSTGDRNDLVELQRKLKESGLDLPNLRHTGGSDPLRYLGLLSRYPIHDSNPAPKIAYELRDEPMVMMRGILHAQVDVHGRELHFIGAHLISKYELSDPSQEQSRSHEAYLVREHADTILDRDPSALAIVYGTLNDTRNTAANYIVEGDDGSRSYFEAVDHPDSLDEMWTYKDVWEDVYYRADFVHVSASLLEMVVADQCRTIDDAQWRNASDHRPLLSIIGLEAPTSEVEDVPSPDSNSDSTATPGTP